MTDSAGAISTRRVVGAGAAQVGSRIGSAFIGVLATAAIARSLTTAEFADFSVILALVMAGLASLDFGATQVATREMVEHRERRAATTRALVLVELSIGTTFAIGCFAACLALLDTSQSRTAAAIMLLALPLAASGGYAALAQSQLRHELYALASLLQSVAWGAAIAALLVTDISLMTVAVAFTASLAIQAALLVRLTRGLADFKSSSWRVTSDAKKLIRTSWKVGLASLMVVLYYRLNIALLQRLSPTEDVAAYGAAYRIFDLTQMLPSVAASLAIPLLAGARARGGEQRVFAAFTTVVTTLCFGVAGIALVSAHGAIAVLYGPSFVAAEAPLRILLPGLLATSIAWVAAGALITRQRYTVYLAIAAFGLMVSIGVNLALIPSLGAKGAALGSLLTEFTVAAALIVTIARRTELQVPAQRLARGCGAALCAAAPLAASSTLPLVPALAVSTASWCIGLLLFRPLTATELRALFSRQPIGGTS